MWGDCCADYSRDHALSAFCNFEQPFQVSGYSEIPESGPMPCAKIELVLSQSETLKLNKFEVLMPFVVPLFSQRPRVVVLSKKGESRN